MTHSTPAYDVTPHAVHHGPTALTGSPDRAAARARADVAAYRANPSVLPALHLGRFSDAGLRSLLLRRLLLMLPLRVIMGAARRLARLTGPASKASAWLAEVVYWRTAKALLPPAEFRSLAHGPVILMYHAVGQSGEPASRYVLPEAQFRRHMAWLRMRRCHLLTLRELVQLQEAGQLPPPRSVVVTFDDGYRDNLPALLRTRVPATIFVVTAALGHVNAWDSDGELSGRAMLTWDDARLLAASGVEIAAHSRTHPALTDVSRQRLRAELSGLLADLHRELGSAAYTFAYPHGRFDAAVQTAVQAAGFVAAGCSRGGVNDPFVHRYALRRVEVKGADSLVSFILMAEFGRRITLREFLKEFVT